MSLTNITKFSLNGMLSAYRENKQMVDAYMRGDIVENLDDDDKKVLGMPIAVFVLTLVIVLIIWIWALVLLVTYFNTMPIWAQILGVLGVVPGLTVGPLITIILVYVTRNSVKGARK